MSDQSGHPPSKHHADLMPLWRAVEYVPMYWDEAKVKAEAVGRLYWNRASVTMDRRR
jgi:acyl-homoserine lactone acylase PvdQ